MNLNINITINVIMLFTRIIWYRRDFLQEREKKEKVEKEKNQKVGIQRHREMRRWSLWKWEAEQIESAHSISLPLIVSHSISHSISNSLCLFQQELRLDAFWPGHFFHVQLLCPLTMFFQIDSQLARMTWLDTSPDQVDGFAVFWSWWQIRLFFCRSSFLFFFFFFFCWQVKWWYWIII